jgi:hypothetical protein
MGLPRYDLAILDNVPRAASGALIYVYTQPVTPALTNLDGTLIIPTPWTATMGGLASLYTDPLAAYPLSNPFPLDGNGNGWFYAVAGTYTVVINGSTLAYPAILPDQILVLSSAGGVSIEVNGSPTSNQALLNLIQGTNVTLASSGGNITISGTAHPLTLEYNYIANGSQTLLNLVAGSGITITDDTFGDITFASTGGILLETNGVTNGSQSLLNLFAGANMTVTDNGLGTVTFVAGYPAFEANSSPLSASDTINFQSGSGITITNPSAGIVNISGNFPFTQNQSLGTVATGFQGPFTVTFTSPFVDGNYTVEVAAVCGEAPATAGCYVAFIEQMGGSPPTPGNGILVWVQNDDSISHTVTLNIAAQAD